MKIVRRKHIFILVHFFSWMIFSFGVLFSRPGEWKIDAHNEICTRQFILLGILMIIFYANSYLLIPYLLLRKKIMLYIFIISGITLFFSFIGKFDINFFLKHKLIGSRPSAIIQQQYKTYGIDTFVLGMILLILGLSIAISFIQKWQEELQLRQHLEKEKISSDLSLLKAQINPHFFFNTLNTIYAFTLSDGDVARTAITNLSKMMRYVLYEAEAKHTPLSHEIEFIKEYVALMRLRLTNKTSIDFKVSQSNTNGADIMIAPMLFLPFIENAFKHGVSNVNAGHIHINIIRHPSNCVELIVHNTHHKKDASQKNTGIGIQNTKRRLALLYPGNYELNIQDQQHNKFQVNLKLFL